MPQPTTPLFNVSQQITVARTSLRSRHLKLYLAFAIGTAGLYGILSEQRYVSTTDAVLSAYILDVPTPAEGILRNLPETAGETVTAGTLLGEVENTLTDHQHLDEMQMVEGAARSRAEALARERTLLTMERVRMLSRAKLHTELMTHRLEQQENVEHMTLAAKEAALQEADLALNRGGRLAKAGVISRAAYDALASSQQITANSVRAQESSLAAVQVELEGARKGLLSEPGTNNDVAYSAQRADELIVKLAENERELRANRDQAKEAHSTAEAEEKRSSLSESSELRAPSSGRIWKLYAINGEHIEAGAPVMSMVDCHRPFVIAEIPQDRVSAIALNSKAQVRLTGEAEFRKGTVMTVSSDQNSQLDTKLAAAPIKHLTGDVSTVLIRLNENQTTNSTDSGCLVGRTARVRIRALPKNLLSIWLSKL